MLCRFTLMRAAQASGMAMAPQRCLTRILSQKGCLPTTSIRRSSSASASSPHPMQHIFEEMKARPAKLIPDYLTPMPSHLLTTTLNDLQPPPVASTTAADADSFYSTPIVSKPPRSLPQGHHLVYFPIQLAPSQLVPDGTDPDHSPDIVAFPRRMWAGGEVVFRPGWRSELLMDGRPWLCKEDIADVRAVGREGEEKVFVDVRRRYGLGHDEATGAGERGGEAWQIEERRTLVFLRQLASSSTDSSASHAAAPGPGRIIKSPHRPDFRTSLTPSAIHLFNFSALTYNAHAIHLDRLYAADNDGHRSLLVHGPLTLALMLRVLASRVDAAATISSISYRNHAPLYVDEELTVCVRKGASRGDSGAGERWDVWLERPDGGLAVKGSALVQ